MPLDAISTARAVALAAAGYSQHPIARSTSYYGAGSMQTISGERLIHPQARSRLVLMHVYSR